MTSATFPMIRTEAWYPLFAAHDLRGITVHPDAMSGVHSHEWIVTVIFEHPYNPKMGFIRDDFTVDEGWGARIKELTGKNLSELMGLPATAENLACWLLFYWLPRLSPNELNFELSAVRVSKGGHSVEVKQTEQNARAWAWFGGEVV